MVVFGLRLKGDNVSEAYFLKKKKQVNNIKGFTNPFKNYSCYYKEGCQVVSFDLKSSDWGSFLLLGIVAFIIIGTSFGNWAFWGSGVCGFIYLLNKYVRSSFFFRSMTRRGLRQSGYTGEIKSIKKSDVFLLGLQNGSK